MTLGFLGFGFPCCWLAMPCPGCGRHWPPLCQDTSHQIRTESDGGSIQWKDEKTTHEMKKGKQMDRTTWQFWERERETCWAMSAMVSEACSALACSGCILKCKSAFIFRAGASYCLFTIIYSLLKEPFEEQIIDSVILRLDVSYCIVSVSTYIVQCMF